LHPSVDFFTEDRKVRKVKIQDLFSILLAPNFRVVRVFRGSFPAFLISLFKSAFSHRVQNTPPVKHSEKRIGGTGESRKRLRAEMTMTLQ
jgi:hypothetical protein